MVAKTIELPNIKKCFIPDPGYIIGDFDLKQADAQVVAWEADDDVLKEIFRTGADLHRINAEDLNCGRLEAKKGVHLTNYLGTPRTLAAAIGCTVHVAENFQRRWFDIHPGISDWHRRIESSLQKTRSVSNKFGYTRTYFGRIENILKEAVAWIPQSTVAIIITKALNELDQYDPFLLHLLLQVHDSIVHQFKPQYRDLVLQKTKKAMEIEVPYDDPLIIPCDAALSTVSWGDCEKVDWPEAA
jgi:DNA polymerase-1